LMNYHIGRLVLSSLCVGALVWLVLGGVRFAGFSLQNEHHTLQNDTDSYCVNWLHEDTQKEGETVKL